MRPGDVVPIGKFDMVHPNATFSFRAPSRKEVYVFMFMGVEAKDGSTVLDVEKVMDQLGWEPKK